MFIIYKTAPTQNTKVIYNSTRTDKNIDRAVDLLVGKRFGLLHKLRNGGNGSEPYVIQGCSPDFKIDTTSQAYERKCNIELRPYGIIVHFHIKYSSFIWPIAYDALSMSLDGQRIAVNDGVREAALYPHVKTKKESLFIQKVIKSQAAFLCLKKK